MYATVLSGGFGSGGLLLALLGSEGWTPWLAGGAIYALGALPILILKGPQIEPPSVEDSGLKSLVGAAQLAPMAILAGLVFGGLETNVFSLMPVTPNESASLNRASASLSRLALWARSCSRSHWASSLIGRGGIAHCPASRSAL